MIFAGCCLHLLTNGFHCRSEVRIVAQYHEKTKPLVRTAADEIPGKTLCQQIPLDTTSALFKMYDGSPAIPVRDDVKHTCGCRGDCPCGHLDDVVATVVAVPYAGQLAAVGGAGHLGIASALPSGGQIDGVRPSYGCRLGCQNKAHGCDHHNPFASHFCLPFRLPFR